MIHAKRARAMLAAMLLAVSAAPLHAAEPEDEAEAAEEAQRQESSCKVSAEEIAALGKSAGLPARVASGEPTPPKRAIKEILAGPDFSPEEVFKIPTLKRKADTDAEPPHWMKRMEAFFRALAELLRAGVWVLVGLGVILLLFGLHYWWRIASARPHSVPVELPARVAGLDIRPESLPDDVGAAARSAWMDGDVIGALSLLYRGALSALVTRFGAAIRASFTEQECLRAARGAVKASTADYFQSLTRAWLHAVYAKRRPDDQTALALCDGFNAHFAPRPVAVGELAAEGAA
jgi:hypothetical protein